jgi:anthranilate phosphoribosyltransferase
VPAKVVSRAGEQLLTPASLHLPLLAAADLAGGRTVAEAAGKFRDVLEGRATPAQRAAVTANAALALRCARPTDDFATCLAAAEESLDSGRARQAFARLLET